MAPQHPTTSWLEAITTTTTLPSTSTITSTSSSTPSGLISCIVDNTHIVISRNTLIAVLIFSTCLTLLSTAAATYLLYREWLRRREQHAARVWGQEQQFSRHWQREHGLLQPSNAQWTAVPIDIPATVLEESESGDNDDTTDAYNRHRTLWLQQHAQSERARKTAVERARRMTHMSQVRKEVDDTFSRRFQGCWQNPAENPELIGGGFSPVEMGMRDLVFVEVAADAPRVPEKDGRYQQLEDGAVGKRKSVISLFFDNTIGLWRPKK